MVESRWPGVIGMIGIILGVLIAIDQIDDLLIHVWWTEADWARYLGPDIADLIVHASGSTVLRVLSSVAEACLGVFLVVASVRLRARRRSGVSLSRTWSWLAIVFALVETATAAVLLSEWREEMAAMSGSDVEGYVRFGIGVALAIMIAWPLFLLIWTGLDSVEIEVESWPE